MGRLLATLRTHTRCTDLDRMMFDLILQVLLEFFGSIVARLVLRVITFGRVYVRPLSSSQAGFNALGYRHDVDGKIEISSSSASVIGVLISLTAFLLAWVLIRAV